MKIKVIATLLALCCLAGCTPAETEKEVAVAFDKPATEIEYTRYVTTGRYYTSGQLITSDGNVWSYTQDIISETESYDHQPVYAVFEDNGTPHNIYDDEVCGLVRDVETEIYDELEMALSDSFDIERNGNVISVLNQK
jgi:hypothetical protein